MKTTTRICAIAAFIFTLTLQAQVTRTINTQEYDIIDASGSMTVTLERGAAEGTIQVIAEEQAQEYVDIESNGTTLVIKLKKNLYKVSKKGVKIIVPFTELSEVHLKGSGDVIGKDVISATNFETSLSGSGDMNLKIEADTVEASLTGSGDLNLSGTTNSLAVSMTGSGDFDSLKLATQNTEATLTGSGDISVNAQQSINAVVKGSGDIEYSGNPEIKNTKVYGSGERPVRRPHDASIRRIFPLRPVVWTTICPHFNSSSSTLDSNDMSGGSVFGVRRLSPTNVLSPTSR